MVGTSTAHAQIEINIGAVLHYGLRETECNVYSSSLNVHVAENRIYLPDLTVSCDPADWTRKRVIKAPTVVVEILSPKTEQVDRLEKLPTYKAYPTIQDILYVDSRRRSIEHYHRLLPEQWRWEEARYTHDEEMITLESIGVTLMVRDAYLKVHLELEDEV